MTRQRRSLCGDDKQHRTAPGIQIMSNDFEPDVALGIPRRFAAPQRHVTARERGSANTNEVLRAVALRHGQVVIEV
jgi:hypothetical protein